MTDANIILKQVREIEALKEQLIDHKNKFGTIRDILCEADCNAITDKVALNKISHQLPR